MITLKRPVVTYICKVDALYGKSTIIYKIETQDKELYWKCTGKPIDLKKDIFAINGTLDKQGGHLIKNCRVHYDM